jgi:hypothetical protein
MGKQDALMRRVRWLADATGQARPAARPTLRDVETIQQTAKAFIEQLAANLSLDAVHTLDRIAKSAREQARRDKSEARDYIATAVSLETLHAHMLSTLEARDEFAATLKERSP